MVAELRYGCARSAKSAANRAAVDALLDPYPSLPIDDAAVDSFVTLRTHLEALGTPIGPYDMQIAAIALANGCTLVTHIQAEFCRVPALLIEDWETPRIEMVGGYDEMSDRSYPDYPGGTSLQRWRRDLLRREMGAEGFTVYSAEWWYFDFKDWLEYPIGNVTFEEIGAR